MISIPSAWRNSAGSPPAIDHAPRAQPRARRFLALNAALGAAALIAVATALAGSERSIRVVAGARAGHLTLLGLHFSRPVANLASIAVLALALIGLVMLLRGFGAFAAELLASRHLLRSLAPRGVLHRREDFLVFDDPTVLALCAGLVRPQIYVSSGALAALSGAELDTVLAHERHHRHNRDPLRIALGRVLARALFFLPVVELLHQRYCALAELAADETALRARPDGTKALASALLAFAGEQPRDAAVGIAPERVDQLMGRSPDWPLPTAVVAAGVAGFALVVVSTWQLAHAASLRTTLSLPFVSGQPCIMLLALVPSVFTLIVVARLRHMR